MTTIGAGSCRVLRAVKAFDLVFRVALAILLLALCIVQAQSDLSTFLKILGTIVVMLIVIRQAYGTSSVATVLRHGTHVRREALIVFVVVCVLVTLWTETGLRIVFAYLSMGCLLLVILSDAGSLRTPKSIVDIFCATDGSNRCVR
jgi:hypothetical protein